MKPSDKLRMKVQITREISLIQERVLGTFKNDYRKAEQWLKEAKECSNTMADIKKRSRNYLDSEQAFMFDGQETYENIDTLQRREIFHAYIISQLKVRICENIYEGDIGERALTLFVHELGRVGLRVSLFGLQHIAGEEVDKEFLNYLGIYTKYVNDQIYINTHTSLVYQVYVTQGDLREGLEIAKTHEVNNT